MNRRRYGGVWSVTRTLRDYLCCCFLVTFTIAIDSGNPTDIHPYLMFSTQQSIFKHILNGTSSYTEQVLTTPSFGILGLSYHLRLDTIFWTSDFSPSIMTARLNGSNVQELIYGDIGEPADLAVDWINDRLYWVDRTWRQISEYDLHTGHRTVVLSTGEAGNSNPSAIALFPYPNYGWVYWSDGNRLQRASVTGDDLATLRSDLDCVNVLTIDYAAVSIYWIDACRYEIQSLRLDGDAATHSYPFGTTSIFFASGLAIHNDTFYWSDQDGVFERGNTSDSAVVTIYDAPSSTRATGLQLIHASMQPQVAEFIEIVVPENTTFQCSVVCVNGVCIPPGLCACTGGWRGTSCDTDVNECERLNGGCEDQCLNDVGSFHCTCPDGYRLASNSLSCEDVDECSDGNGGCHQVCNNQPGTFTCSCHNGYNIPGDSGYNCVANMPHVSVGPVMGGGTYSSAAQVNRWRSAGNSLRFSATATDQTHSAPTPITDTVSASIRAMTFSEDKMSSLIAAPLSTSIGVLGTLSTMSASTVAVDRTLSPTENSRADVTSSITSEQTLPPLPVSDMVQGTSVVKISNIETTLSGPTTSPQGTSVARGNRKTSRPLSFPPSHPSPVSTNTQSSLLQTSSTLLPLSPTPEVDGDIDVATTSRDETRQTVIITTVLVTLICICIATVGLLVILVAVRKKRQATGSYSPEQEPPQHAALTLNLSVKRIISTLSYSSKT